MHIQRVIESASGKIGVAVRVLETDDTVSVNGHERFPTFSVYKFPIALAVLDRVDSGLISLDQKIPVTEKDLLPNTWSPLRQKYPQGSSDITLDELLNYTVSLSDNNGCDILLRLLGGPRVAEKFIRDLGIEGIGIAATEEEMGKGESAYLPNWSSPDAMTDLLGMLYKGKILSKQNTQYLLKIMENTSTGPGRIKGLLPPEAVLAHKTGSSGTSDGVTIATNDVGIVTLPDGKHFAISVFIADAAAEEKACELTIARIARILWDAYAAP